MIEINSCSEVRGQILWKQGMCARLAHKIRTLARSSPSLKADEYTVTVAISTYLICLCA